MAIYHINPNNEKEDLYLGADLLGAKARKLRFSFIKSFF